jgi:hypothetical protein
VIHSGATHAAVKAHFAEIKLGGRGGYFDHLRLQKHRLKHGLRCMVSEALQKERDRRTRGHQRHMQGTVNTRNCGRRGATRREAACLPRQGRRDGLCKPRHGKHSLVKILDTSADTGKGIGTGKTPSAYA